MTLLRDFKGLYGYSYIFALDNKENFEIGVLDVE